MRPNLKKVIELFQPDSNGVSQWKTIEEIQSFGLSWSNNGNIRRGIAFGVHEYHWEFIRSKSRKIIKLKLSGYNHSSWVKNSIRRDIITELLKKDKSNFSPDSIVPLTENDKEIDHRWGRKECSKYSYINDLSKQTIDDFQLLSHSHNQFKRQKCVECKDTNFRFLPPNNMPFKIGNHIWNDEIGCQGCPLAQPELYL